MKVLILAAGFGTRLYPLTKDIPKPLLKIGKKYLVDYILEKFEKTKDIREILIITNQRFYRNFLNWAKRKDFDKKLRILNDKISNFNEKEEVLKRYAIVKIDRDSKIIYYKEKPKKVISKLVGICLYYFPKERLGEIKEFLSLKDTKKDAPGNYIAWLYKRIPVYGFKFKGDWFDIGHPDTYRKACLMVDEVSE
jgi:glucose-1-phosphate thymidylyltransferase